MRAVIFHPVVSYDPSLHQAEKCYVACITFYEPLSPSLTAAVEKHMVETSLDSPSPRQSRKSQTAGLHADAHDSSLEKRSSALRLELAGALGEARASSPECMTTAATETVQSEDTDGRGAEHVGPVSGTAPETGPKPKGHRRTGSWLRRSRGSTSAGVSTRGDISSDLVDSAPKMKGANGVGSGLEAKASLFEFQPGETNESVLWVPKCICIISHHSFLRSFRRCVNMI